MDMKTRFDLEQDILAIYSVREDLRTLQELVLDREEKLSEDDLSNYLMGLEHVLNLKLDRLWDTFCQTYKIDNYSENK
jgi:hypothetical protein